MGAVGTLLGQRQLLADAPVLRGERLALVFLGLAPLQSQQQRLEGVPFGLVAAFEKTLLHACPISPRAIPLSSASARSACTSRAGASIPAISARRPLDRPAWRSAKPSIARCSSWLSAKGARSGLTSGICGRV